MSRDDFTVHQCFSTGVTVPPNRVEKRELNHICGRGSAQTASPLQEALPFLEPRISQCTPDKFHYARGFREH